MEGARKILVLNIGSSSAKSSLFVAAGSEPPPQTAWEAQLSRLGEGRCVLTVQAAGGPCQERDLRDAGLSEALRAMLSALWDGKQAVVASPSEIDVVGHRIVHGGARYRQATAISADVLADIRSYAPMAPAHQPDNICGVEMAGELFPCAAQVAVFDTAFHHAMPEVSVVYPLPYEWYERLGIRRYGFHGISHGYCLRRAEALTGGARSALRAITCHLGSGSSLSAVRDGRCLTTTMGYTPLEGLVMRSRSGSVDPGLLLELIEQKSYSAGELSRILNHESGLKGVSGLSGDMKEIIARARAGDRRAKLAFDIYIHSLRSNIGALLPVLGGLDVLAFTGGVGENSPEVRAAACEAFTFMGLRVDPARNETCRADGLISAEGSAAAIAVIYCREDRAIAEECVAVLESSSESEPFSGSGPSRACPGT